MSNVDRKLLGCALLASLFMSSICFEELNGSNKLKETPKDPRYKEYRLPDSLVPYNYEISYENVDLKNSNFSGSVTIKANVQKKTDRIVLHCGNSLHEYAIVKLIDLESGKELEIKEVSPRNSTTEKLEIILKNAFPEETKKISFTIDFKGNLRNDMTGFYKSSYYTKNGTLKLLAATQFEAISARHAFPCFDEPEFKAEFDISFNLDETYKSLSNSIEKAKNRFTTTKKMSTYLVAFVILEDPKDFTEEHYYQSKEALWSREETKNQRSYSVRIAHESLSFFENIFNLKYPLEKMDLVALPDFAAGAMENWGLLTFRESNILVDDADSTNANTQQASMVVAHEVAHNWFGNLVTPKWWSYLWLSEAFARYWQYMAVDQIETKWKLKDQFVVDIHQAAYETDGVVNSKAMTRDAFNKTEIEGMGDMICYNKGASVVRMMEHAFGHDKFIKALSNYLKNKEYSSSTPDDLWEALEKEVKDDKLPVKVADVMKSWTEKAGFPYISVTVTQDEITLTQERFLIQNPDKVSSSEKWIIPISLLTSDDSKASTKPVEWMKDKEMKISNKNKDAEWVLLNVQSTGFYRVKYDENSLRNIFSALKTEHDKIDEINRAAFVDDLLNLARAELLDYTTVFDGLEYLKKEKGYLPIKAALNDLDHLIRKFSDSEISVRNTFNQYVLSLFDVTYNYLGYIDKKEDDQHQILLRQELNKRFCSLGHNGCTKQFKNLFNNWMVKPKDFIPKNQRSTAYCTAINSGGEDEWKFLWNKYKESNVASEKLTILAALGCSKDDKILEKYLLDTITKPFHESFIRKQDFKTVFNGIQSASLDNAYFLADFVERKIDIIKGKNLEESELVGLISGALQKYPTKKMVKKVETIITKSKISPKSLEALKSSLKLATYEVDLFSKLIKNLEKEKYRLPKHIIPTSYNLHITPMIEKAVFSGDVTVEAKVEIATNKITLHADQLKIKKEDVSVIGDKNDTYKIEDMYFDSEHYSRVYIKLVDIIKIGSVIKIRIKYNGILNSEMKGFYISQYKNEKGELRKLVASHLEPVGARRMFPCFDEPALKATFIISVTVPEGYHAISNMELKTKIQNKYIFGQTKRMSTYLVALVVSDFENKSGKEGNRIAYNVYANPQLKNQLDYSLSVMNPTVSYFEEKLGIKYELSKLDMVALPDFSAGAMENWGLITYRETGMLYDDKKMSTLNNKQSIRNVIAHEIAHQWFGNLVTPDWWSHIWLSEGFARYFQYFAHSESEKSWDLENQFVVDHLHTSMVNDATTSTHPISNEEVSTPKEIKDMFDSISYAKAGSIIRMVEKLMGPKKFFSALKNYLNKCSYNTGTPELLFEYLQKELKKGDEEYFEVDKVLKSWTTQPGFPVVSAKLIGDQLLLDQRRFFTRPPKNNTEDLKWSIPITYFSQINPKPKKVEWMDSKYLIKVTKEEREGWIILNHDQIGYYRVNYDQALWKKIIVALNSTKEREKIPLINRAAIIDDLMNLGRAGLVDYETVFSGLSYLKFEDNYIPWKAAFNNLPYLSKRFENQTSIDGMYKNYLISLLENNYKRLGSGEKEKETDRHTDVFLRKLVHDWLCKLDHKGCVEEANKLFKQELNNTKTVIPPSQRSWVYCTGIKKGSPENFEKMFAKFNNSVYATEQATILSSLACSTDKKNLMSLLKEAISEQSGIRFQDTKTVFTNVINSGPVGVEAASEFIEFNHNEIMEYLTKMHSNNATNAEFMIQGFINVISKRVSNKYQLEKLKIFLKNIKPKMPFSQKTIATAESRAESEIKWFEENAGKIHSYLRKNNPLKTYQLDPNIVKPYHYDIEIEPTLDPSFEFKGKVEIEMEVYNETFEIAMHSKGLKLEKPVSYTLGSKKEKYEVDSFDLDEKYEKLYVQFNKQIPAGTKLRLVIKFVGKLNDDMQGFYRSSYVNEKGVKTWMATTHFEPTHTREAFPCFDEPRFKATFTMHIARPVGYTSLSNMADTKKTTKKNDKLEIDHYEPTVKMAPYVLAFVVSDFVPTPSKPAPSESPKSYVTVWSRPQLATHMNDAVQLGLDSIRILNEFTLMSYPLKEMNLVAVPDFAAGAMENWGLVTFREYGLAYNETTISASYNRYVVTTIAHELVHMWFGNLVTCEKWDYTWLNEGFADYLAYVVSDVLKPEWQLLKQFVVLDLHTALSEDQLDTSHPMNQNVTTPAEAAAGFDTIEYKKAGSVLRMLRDSFGQGLFREALHAYLNKRQYDTGRPEHLVLAFQERANFYRTLPGNLDVKDVTKVMNSWITQAGYPVIEASRNEDTVTIHQKRFLLTPNNTFDGIYYEVPITYTSDSERNFNDTKPKLWLSKDAKSFKVKKEDNWYILNIQEIGYYRVNYDDNNWRSLIKVLNSDDFKIISDLNRAQLIDDSFNLARANVIGWDIPLNLSQYLTRETSHLPWKAYFSATAYLSRRIGSGVNVTTEDKQTFSTLELYNKHIQAILGGTITKLGYNEGMDHDDHLSQLNRDLLSTNACKYKHEDCQNKAKEYFKKADPVTPNIASAVYCTAMESASYKEWEEMWKKYENTLLASDYVTYLKALGCSKNPEILKKYMNRIFKLYNNNHTTVRKQDVTTALSSIYSSSLEGLKAATEYYEENLEKLHKEVYDNDWEKVGSLFKSLAAYYTTKEDIDKLDSLIKSNKAINIKPALESAKKTATKNKEWYDRNQAEITNWLVKNYHRSSASIPALSMTFLVIMSLVHLFL